MQKSHQKIVNPRHIEENAEEKEETTKQTAQGASDIFFLSRLIVK